MVIIRAVKKLNKMLSRDNKKSILRLFVLMIFGGILELFSVSMIIPFISLIMSPERVMNTWYGLWFTNLLNIDSTKDFLAIIAVGLAFLFIFKNAYLLFEYNIQYKFVYDNMVKMQSKVLNSFLYRPYEYYMTIDSGEVIRTINNDISVTYSLLLQMLVMMAEFVVTVMLTITVFIIAPVITLSMAAVMLILIIVLGMVIKPAVRRAGEDNKKAVAGMNKWIIQSIQGIKEIKVMEKELFFRDQFDKNGLVFANAIRKNQLLNTVPRFVIEAACMGTMFLSVAFLVLMGGQIETLAPMLSAVAMAAIRLLPSASRISNGLSYASYSEPMLDNVLDCVSSPYAQYDCNICDTKKQINPLTGKIEFSNVTFRYSNSETNILDDASMVIGCGESVGIVGASGSGKTTTVDIILGLLKPQSGHVLVDGIDITTGISSWYEQIAYIPQTIFLLDGNIRDNIALGDENVSDEKIWKALQEASLDEFVRKLPDGLENQIGERGIRISGGQKQRIGIARALYKDPSVLIFDEATSALDNETESSIMESIHRLHGKKTLIIIAHRLSTIDACDKVYRVENGKIVRER